MVHLYFDLFYEVYNAINQHYHEEIQFLSLIFLKFLDISLKKDQKVFQDFICFITNQNFYIITGIIHRIFRRKNLIAIVD